MEKDVKKEYFPYIDGLKIIACGMIVCYHYLAVYRDAITFGPAIPWLDAVCFSRLGFLTDQGQAFWLYLFFIASGFLLSNRSIASFPQLFQSCLMRFFRFAIPMLFSCLVIWLVGILFGFHNAETDVLFDNPWFRSAYRSPVTLSDALLSPVQVLLLGKSRINTPYWVISKIFYASLLIYLLQYLTHSANYALRFTVFCAAAVLIWPLEREMGACLVGAATLQLRFLLPKGKWTSFLSLFFAFGFLFAYLYLLYRRPEYSKPLVSCFFAAAFLFTDSTDPVRRLFSSSILSRLNRLSWGIYSFHWPLICSVGSLLLLRATPGIGLASAYGLCCFMCVCLTLLLSLLYHRSLERLSDHFLRLISQFISKMFSGA